MALIRGRIVRGDAGATLEVPGATTVQGRVVPRRLVEAERHGAHLLEEARRAAELILAEARASAATAREDAAREGRDAGALAVAVHWVRAREEEARALEAAEDRVLLSARALAERLLGRELALSRDTVVDLARVALAAASRARRVLVKAHPDDVEALQGAGLSEVLDGRAVEVQGDVSRAPGCLRIETDIGVLDGDLAPQLDRLVRALRRS